MLLDSHITTESVQGKIYSQESMNGGGTRTPLGNLVVELPASGQRTTPGLELAAGSITTDPEHFAIGNEPSLLDKNSLQKIGKTPAILPRRQFPEELRTMAALTQTIG